MSTSGEAESKAAMNQARQQIEQLENAFWQSMVDNQPTVATGMPGGADGLENVGGDIEDALGKRCLIGAFTIPIEGGGRGKMIEMLRTRWAPHLANVYGVRLLGAWAEVGSTAAWPQVRVQWEMDDWEALGRAAGARLPLADKDPYGCEIERHSLPLRSGGRRSLLVATSYSPDRARIQAERLSAAVVMQESFVARPAAT